MNNGRSTNHSNDINIRDLQSLLRKSFNNKKLILIDSEISRLVSIEESYGSVVLKLDAKIQGINGKKIENLNLVAKVLNDSSDRPYFDWPKVLKKEVFVYAKLMPVYQELERQAGIKDVIDILPKYVGHRYSLDECSQEIDENSVILIENLNPRNFYTCDRLKGNLYI